MLPVAYSCPISLSFQTINTIAECIIAAGVLIAFWELRLLKNKEKNDVSYRESDFYLNKISEYFEKTLSILSEDKNGNIKWVTVATILESAVALSKNITEKTHQETYIIEFITAAFVLADILSSILKDLDNPYLDLDFFIEDNGISKNKLVVILRFIYRASVPANEYGRGLSSMSHEEKFKLFTLTLSDKNSQALSDKERNHFENVWGLKFD